jgi:hypothetical protein
MIPITILDNFLENPDEIVNFALSLNYSSDPNNRWPGQRTNVLRDINPYFAQYIESKILSIFIPLDRSVSYESTSNFQLIENLPHNGWIHSDSPNQITSIIYLNKDTNKKCGTSLYKQKSYFPIENPQDKKLVDSTRSQHHQNNTLTQPQLQEKLNWENKHFTKIQEVNNSYNRLFCFPSNIPHSATKFTSNSTSPRLTLVTFFKNIISPIPFPLNRVNNIPPF